MGWEIPVDVDHRDEDRTGITAAGRMPAGAEPAVRLDNLYLAQRCRGPEGPKSRILFFKGRTGQAPFRRLPSSCRRGPPRPLRSQQSEPSTPVPSNSQAEGSGTEDAATEEAATDELT